MTSRLGVLYRFILRSVFVIILAISVIFALLGFLIIAAIVITITWFPAWIGSLFPVGKWLRKGMALVLDFERMRSFRDDMLNIYRRQVKLEEGVDRWWMLREMEKSKERIDVKLQNGRLVLALTGGVSSILLATYSNVQIASVVLTIFVLGISLVVLLRILINDVLAYDAELYREAPYDEVMARLGWNRGPINGRGAVLTALGTFLVGLSESGYRLGLWILATYVARNYGEQDFEKWKDNTSSKT